MRVVTGHERDTLAGVPGGPGTAGLAADGSTVVAIDPVNDTRWDAFVRRHPGAGAYHLGAWARILGDAYGFEPVYLGIVDASGEIRGGLPVMRTRGIVTGRRLRSLPVVPPTGPLGRSEEDERSLIAAACRACDEGGRVWTLHARRSGYEAMVPALRPLPKHPTWILDLPDDPDELRRGWKKTSNNLFRNLKKADGAGVTVRLSDSEQDLRAFHRLYLRTMRRRCALPRTWTQLAEDRRLLGPDGVFRLFVAEHEGDLVAAGVFHAFGDTLDLLYNGSDDARLDVRPNHALYWHAIQWAVEAGHTRLDFGHARPDSSLARFKAQWSAEEVPEYRYDYVPGGEREESVDLAQKRPLHGRGRQGAIERVWPRLPLGITRLAGRIAYRWL
jgi:hypothetical protein